MSQNRLSIGNVASGSVFGRAGIRQGDVIVSVNGRRVFRQDDFSRWIYDSGPNERVTIIVLRDGREQPIYVNAAEFVMLRPTSNRAVLGVNVARQYPDEVILSNVNPDGPAARAGLKRGDEILSVEGEEVRSASELTAAIGRFQPGDEVEIEYARGEEVDTTNVRLDAAAATLPHAQYGSERPPRRLEYSEGAEYELSPDRSGAQPGSPRTEGPRDDLLPGRVRERIQGR
jgi:S1-C subfamily serine protease